MNSFVTTSASPSESVATMVMLVATSGSVIVRTFPSRVAQSCAVSALNAHVTLIAGNNEPVAGRLRTVSSAASSKSMSNTGSSIASFSASSRSADLI